MHFFSRAPPPLSLKASARARVRAERTQSRMTSSLCCSQRLAARERGDSAWPVSVSEARCVPLARTSARGTTLRGEHPRVPLAPGERRGARPTTHTRRGTSRGVRGSRHARGDALRAGDQEDDLSPQIVAYALEQMLAAGALDAWSVAAMMKKEGWARSCARSATARARGHAVRDPLFQVRSSSLARRNSRATARAPRASPSHRARFPPAPPRAETSSLGVRVRACDRVSLDARSFVPRRPRRRAAGLGRPGQRQGGPPRRRDERAPRRRESRALARGRRRRSRRCSGAPFRRTSTKTRRGESFSRRKALSFRGAACAARARVDGAAIGARAEVVWLLSLLRARSAGRRRYEAARTASILVYRAGFPPRRSPSDRALPSRDPPA